MNIAKNLLITRAPRSVILIRMLTGAVFLSEGIQKFLNPLEVGAIRFSKIGFPMPGFLAHFVGAFEIVSGLLIIVGLFTRPAIVPLIIIIIVAIISTKVPILSFKGFWAAAHEARTDYSMLLGLLFLLIVGAGPWSIDGRLADPP